MGDLNTDKQEPLGVLFGILAYHTNDELQDFINRLNSGSKTDLILTINTILTYFQGMGVLTLKEAEVLSITLRKIESHLKTIKS